MKKVAIYSRVSTDEQDYEVQSNILKEYAEKRKWEVMMYEEIGSGANTKRPVLNQLLKDAQQRKFDIFLIWKIDRLAKNMAHFIYITELLKALEIEFVSYSEPLDTTLPSGKLIFNVLGAIAEFENSLLSQRIKEGMKYAKKKGKKIGRPKVPLELETKIINLRKQGLSYGTIAKQLKCKTRGIVAGIVRRYFKDKKDEKSL